MRSSNRLSELRNNDEYATAHAYLWYYRKGIGRGNPVPNGTNIQAMAAYWKKHYNTAGGKGTEAKFVKDWFNATMQP